MLGNAPFEENFGFARAATLGFPHSAFPRGKLSRLSARQLKPPARATPKRNFAAQTPGFYLRLKPASFWGLFSLSFVHTGGVSFAALRDKPNANPCTPSLPSPPRGNKHGKRSVTFFFARYENATTKNGTSRSAPFGLRRLEVARSAHSHCAIPPHPCLGSLRGTNTSPRSTARKPRGPCPCSTNEHVRARAPHHDTSTWRLRAPRG